MGTAPSVRVKVEPARESGSMALEKMAMTCTPRGTSDAPAAGLLLVTTGAAGVSVVKLQTFAAARGTPGMVVSLAPVVMVAV